MVTFFAVAPGRKCSADRQVDEKGTTQKKVSSPTKERNHQRHVCATMFSIFLLIRLIDIDKIDVVRRYGEHANSFALSSSVIGAGSGRCVVLMTRVRVGVRVRR